MSFSRLKGEDRYLEDRYLVVVADDLGRSCGFAGCRAHPELATESGRRETAALASVAIREDAATLGMACTGYSRLLTGVARRDCREIKR
jgi:hypothetical protein